jgi:hypothetical protein
MPGVIEQRDVGSLRRSAECLYGLVETRLVQIELAAAADQREAEGAEGLRISFASLAGLSSLATLR